MNDHIGILLSQVGRLMRRAFDERARKLGTTRPQWQVLGMLRDNAGINQGGLADLLEVEPITLGRMIDRLQDAGLVERRADPADRRAWRLHLTERGMAKLEVLMPDAIAGLESMLEGIDPTDREVVLRSLARMRANLSRKTEAATRGITPGTDGAGHG
jgi:DNA-binding MarR family transcriptional regulator